MTAYPARLYCRLCGVEWREVTDGPDCWMCGRLGEESPVGAIHGGRWYPKRVEDEEDPPEFLRA